MADFSGEKDDLRRHFLDARQNLTTEQIDQKSKAITDRLIQLEAFKDADVVHSYVSIKQNQEVLTPPFIQHCLESGKRIVLPKMIGEGKLKHFEITTLGDLSENSWGVPEPEGGKEIPVEMLDLIVVPMVAGDYLKNRIGYGKGYYDRFLEKSSSVSVGLLFDCQLSNKKLPVEEFDIPLDILITESQQIQ